MRARRLVDERPSGGVEVLVGDVARVVVVAAALHRLPQTGIPSAVLVRVEPFARVDSAGVLMSLRKRIDLDSPKTAQRAANEPAAARQLASCKDTSQHQCQSFLP